MIRRILSAKRPGTAGFVDIDIDETGKISAIAPAGERGATASRPASGATLNAAGQTVTSGLWDEHVHLSQWAQQSARLDCGECTEPGAVFERIASAVATGADEVTAVRVRGSAWGEALTRERLDAVSGGVPVVLIGIDLHGAWLNSAALRRYGHDASGTAHVIEEDCFALVRELDRVSEAELDRRVAAAAHAAAARGVVGVVDFEMRWGIADWARRERSGWDMLRVESAIYPQYLERAVAAGLRTGDEVTDSGLIRVGPLKVITDGSLGTHTAWCCDPYPDGGHGRALVSVDELEALLRRAHGAGISAAVHAIGDRATAAALDAFERAACGGRIEHAQLLRRSDLRRFAELGVAASVQPEHLLDDREAIARLWPGRAERAFPFASMLDAGVDVCFGSDAPVAPLDPWRGIAAAVHRALPGEAAWVPAERLSTEQALAATMRGRVRPAVGDVADLILLAEDPLRLAAPELRAPVVTATLLGGRVTFASAR